MKLKSLALSLGLPLLLNGCATNLELDHIKHHADNVEIRITSASDGKITLQWQSQPGYSGNLKTQQSCKYFTPSPLKTASSGPRTIAILPVENRFVRLYSPTKQEISLLIAEFERMSAESCLRLVYGKNPCPGGDSFCSGPFTIHVFNRQDKSTESFALPDRSDIPLSKWPALALDAAVDVSATAIAGAVVIIAAPVAAGAAIADQAKPSVNDEAGLSEKSPNHKNQPKPE